ncbi:MAG: hypothetical protein ACK5C8_14305 [Roseiflexaceae bacterium]|nr:hypothetical protein [Chloroflexaceae bacterium]
MKKSFLLTCASWLCIGMLMAACGTVTHSINITAPDALDICGLYVSPAGADTYGENQLKDGAVLAAKGETQVTVDAAGNYDLKMVACDGQENVMPVSVP